MMKVINYKCEGRNCLNSLINLYNYLLSADTVHEIFHIPLCNSDGKMVASVIGRSKDDPVQAGNNRAKQIEEAAVDEEETSCSAR